MKKVMSKGDFDYIKFDTLDDIKEYVQTTSLLLYRDPDGVLYCYDYYNKRTLKFVVESYSWVKVGLKEFEFFEGFDCIEDTDLKKDILRAIPPYDAFMEMQRANEKETLEIYDLAKKNTPRKVIGWLKEPLEGMEEVTDDSDYFYDAAILNDIEKHNYFFIAAWMQLYPIFDDNKYYSLSDRAMGFLIALSRGEAMDYDYVTYAFGEDYFFEPDGTFNPPKEGFYNED